MNYMRAGGVVKGLAKRAIMLYLTLVISMYITIVVANMGGLVDQYIKSQLILEITYNIKRNPEYRNLPPAEIDKLIKKTFEIEIKRRGLDKPFLVRSFIYLKDALTLDLGRAMYLQSDSGSRQVKIIILERLPQTVMLFTTSMLIHFFVNLFMGLYLARHYGSFLDKLFIALSPTSVIPGWFYGIFLILIFYSWLHVLPPGGIVDVPPPEDPILYSLSVLKHMILPLASWIISGFFLGCYSSRTFFLIFSTEDYVEAARAKGVPPRLIERRYILRPALPPIVTNFALGLIGSWSGAIITERVFNWPGLGMLTYNAINAFDTPVLVGITVIYAYLLMITVFLLDIVYVLIDPRIRLSLGGR